jgi:hypothetical protein
MNLPMDCVPRDDAERELEQRDGDAELDRDHAGDEHDGGKNSCKLDCAHGGLLGVDDDDR